MRLGKTDSTQEAMILLQQYRGHLIDLGRRIAIRIARKNGTVHSRQVRDKMEEMGYLNDPNLKDFWLGAVFSGGPFVWTGKTFRYRNPARNIHERRNSIWKVRGNVEKYTGPLPAWEGVRPRWPEKVKPASTRQLDLFPGDFYRSNDIPIADPKYRQAGRPIKKVAKNKAAAKKGRKVAKKGKQKKKSKPSKGRR